MKADRCRAAVAVLDRALEDGADKVYDDVAEAARCLVQLRDELTSRAREATAADLLQQCNAILSMVVGSEYPLAGIRRDRVRTSARTTSLNSERPDQTKVTEVNGSIPTACAPVCAPLRALHLHSTGRAQSSCVPLLAFNPTPLAVAVGGHQVNSLPMPHRSWSETPRWQPRPCHGDRDPDPP